MIVINGFRKPPSRVRREALSVLRFCCGASNLNALTSRNDFGERD